MDMGTMVVADVSSTSAVEVSVGTVYARQRT